MSQYFEVVGDVMGDYDDDDYVVSGPRARRAKPSPKRQLVQVKRPDWRDRQLAPGVQTPDEGVIPLPMKGEGGTNTFTALLTQIIFKGELQKPFRGERLLVSVVRTGVSAVGRLLGQLFIGTDLQQADITGFDIEQIGDPGAFGVRLTMIGAQPGIAIRLVTTLSTPLAGADTIQANLQLLGRAVY